MKQVLIQAGRASVRDVPAPECGEGEILVRSAYSLISTGTETVTLRESSAPPPGTWSRRAHKLGEVARMIPERGPRATMAAVRERLAGACTVTGYSLAGTVVRVGSGVRDLVPGQRVACAGAEAAHHAELVAVPRNLAVPVPEALSLDRAAFVTLGAIALQGVRQADVRLGEVVFVLGLGLVGQLTVTLVRASGCRVLGSDPLADRVESACRAGLERGYVVGRDDAARGVAEATAGRGVDAVLVTAATPSSEPVREAVRLVRARGRVVVVGAVGLELEREPLYLKEADLRISRSYGPGRHDPVYERDGIDYPYAHVRWTENRNMQEFLRLAATGSLAPEAFRRRVVPLGEADEAYRALSEGAPEARPPAVLLRFPAADDAEPEPASARRVEVVPPPARPAGLGVALVGPGSFARSVHLPNLEALKPAAHLRAVVGRTANPARETARRWAATLASTELDEVLRDPHIDVVLIATRHHLHADQAIRALAAGKAVFLEKPAALDRAGLDRLDLAVRASAQAFTVGFNRRFAPDVAELRERLRDRHGPVVIDYRVNAGKLPPGHWAHGREGGGRLVGEACHMVDLLRHLVGRPVARHRLTVLAPEGARTDLPLGDNFALSCRYGDGSLAQLLYTSTGHADAGKERVEVHWDGMTAIIDDFRGLVVHGAGPAPPARPEADKGHRELLRRFLDHAAGRGPEPVAWEEIVETTRFVLELDREARGEAALPDGGGGRPGDSRA